MVEVLVGIVGRWDWCAVDALEVRRVQGGQVEKFTVGRGATRTAVNFFSAVGKVDAPSDGVGVVPAAEDECR